MSSIEAGISVSPEILSVLGEQLVSDRITALSELVKNSYDADAEMVEVSFLEEKRIVVSDDGHGMTLDDIQNGWLQIGTPLKRRTTSSRSKKRVLVGSMGIGRLAAFSLAHEIKIQTGTGRDWFEFSLSFDRLIEAPTFLSIKIPIQRIPPLRAHGTIITLSDLRWWPTSEEFEKTKQRLSVLAIPGPKRDFAISLRFDGLGSQIEPETILPPAPITLAARIDGQGRVFSTLEANPLLYEGPIPTKRWVAEEGKHSVEYLGNVSLKVFWYALGERPGQTYWKSSLETQRALKELNGLRVYRDSVRVLPYGEQGDDWLDLQRSYVSGGPMQRNPRPQQITGWVTISRLTIPDLGDVANRQGLRDTKSFRALRQFCQDRMDEIAQFRRELEPIVRRREEISPEDRPEIEKAVEVVRSAIAGNPVLEERFSLVEKAIGAFFEQAELTALYRDRLTAGLLASLVMHDVGVPFRNAAPIVIQASGEGCTNERHKKALTIISALVDRVIQGYMLLGGGFSGDDYRIRKVPINETIAASIAQMKAVSESERIRIKLEPSTDPLTAFVRRADIWAIVTNLVANSIQAAGYSHARDRKFPSEREIVVSFRRDGNDLEISCEDNGPGLPEKPTNWIWEVYNTTKPGGSGLGLYIIADIVGSYAGTKLASPSTRFPTGAMFKITLPSVFRVD